LSGQVLFLYAKELLAGAGEPARASNSPAIRIATFLGSLMTMRMKRFADERSTFNRALTERGYSVPS
jgi:hypothetical protein